MTLNLAFMLREAARSHPRKAAVLFAGTEVSYRDIADRLDGLVALAHDRQPIGAVSAVSTAHASPRPARRRSS